MKYLMLIFISVMLVVSCERDNDLPENDTISERPGIPGMDSIDVNADNVADFIVSYRELQTLDEPSSGGSIIGSIDPVNENQILYRETDGYLFLDINDTIRKDVNTHSDWVGYDADIISINRHYQNWDNTWRILSGMKNYYFLAYKLNSDNSPIGWICLDFNIENGRVSISDGDITTSDEIIISKRVTTE